MRALEEMLVIAPRPDCAMVPDRGRHKAKAVVTVRAVPSEASAAAGGVTHNNIALCAKHEPVFIQRAEANGFTVEVIKRWT